MSDLPIPAEAIETAARAIYNEEHPNAPFPDRNEHLVALYSTKARAALRAAFDTLGMEMKYANTPQEYSARPDDWRLVSRWFPVKP